MNVPLPHVNGSCWKCKRRFRFNAFDISALMTNTLQCPSCGHDFGREGSLKVYAAAHAGILHYFRERGVDTSWVEGSTFRAPRLLLRPTRDAIAGLSVFISHHSAQRDWAEDVGRRLSQFGFKVVLVPPIGSPVDTSLTEPQISELLERQVTSSDFLIVLVSPTSVLRDWVREELRLAARTKGRALYLHRPQDTGASIPPFRLPDDDLFDGENPLLVKHVTLVDPVDPGHTDRFAAQLITDPDEGILISPEGPLPVDKRELACETRVSQRVRDYLVKSPAYQDRQVINVYPCFWRRMGIAEGDIDQAASWFRDNYGSYDLLRVGRDYYLSSITVSVDTDAVLRQYYSEGELLCTLVVWRKWQ